MSQAAVPAMPPLRVVAVGVRHYDRFPELPEAEAQATAVARLFGDRAEGLLVPPGTETELWTRLKTALPVADPAHPIPAALVLYWAGHGYLKERLRFSLAAADSDPQSTALITAGTLAELATRTGASQILLIIDACYAGAGVEDAAGAALAVIKERQQYEPSQTWFGVLASAQDWQQARDDLFGPRFIELMTRGPARPSDGWSRRNALVHADDVIKALHAEWPAAAPQKLDVLRYGVVDQFLPNPLFTPLTGPGVAAQLVDAALGGEPGSGGFFTGRVDVRRRLLELVAAPQPGLHVLTGPPGCGKSAVLGWLVCRSDPDQRAVVPAPPGTDDPPEGSVTAGLVARGLSAAQLTRALDLALSADLLAPDRAGHRGIGELVDAIRSSGRCPVLVVDGLDEAGVDETGAEAFAIATEVLRPLATAARVLVGSRDLLRPPALEMSGSPAEIVSTQEVAATGLVATLATDPDRVVWLLDWVDEVSDVTEYVVARLAGRSADMDPHLVAEYINQAPDGESEGRFLFARLLTERLRDYPVPTDAPDWRDRLADSVTDSFTRTLADMAPLLRDGTVVPDAAVELLTALAWAAGSGMPDDVWAAVATVLSPTGTRYAREDVYWALGVAGRFVVEDGNGTQAVYRLAHQQLVDHLRTARSDGAEPVARAVLELMRTLVDQGRALSDHTYLWLHAWQHCAQAGAVGTAGLAELEDLSPGSFTFDLALAYDAEAELHREFGREDSALVCSERAARLIRDLDGADVADSRTAILTRLALAYSRNSQPERAIDTIGEAVEAVRAMANPAPDPMLAGSLGVQAMVCRLAGAAEPAASAAAEAIALLREIVRANPDYRSDLAEAQTELGLSFRELGRIDEARRMLREAADLYADLAAGSAEFRPAYAIALSNLGLVNRDAGSPADALEPGRQAVELNRELATEDPDAEPALALALSNLAMVVRDLGDSIEAIELANEAVGLYRRHLSRAPELATNLVLAYNNLSVALRDAGRPVEAAEAMDQAIAVGRQAGEDPAVMAALATALGNAALGHADLTDIEAALARGRESLELYRELMDRDPRFATPALLNGQARIAGAIGQLLTVNGRPGEALEFAEQAVGLYTELAQINRAARPDLYVARAHLGLIYAGLGHHVEAVREVQQATVLLRNYLQAIPSDQRSSGLIAGLGTVLLGSATVLHVNRPVAQAAAGEAVQLFRQLTERQPVYGSNLAEALAVYAGLLLRSGPSQAEEATAMVDELRALLPSVPVGEGRLADLLAQLALAGAEGRHPAAAGWAAEALALVERLGAGLSERTAAVVTLRALTSRSRLQAQAGRYADALVDARSVVQIMRGLPDEAGAQLVAASLADVAALALHAGDRAEAEAAAREALAGLADLPPSSQALQGRARATSVLAQLAERPGDVWAATYAELPDDAVRLSLLLSALSDGGIDVGVDDLVRAQAWTVHATPVAQLGWRSYCRARRGLDPAAFDAAWRASAADLPAWLQIDAGLASAVNDWVSAVTVEALRDFHAAHRAELARPEVLDLLDEVALVNPEGAQVHRQLYAAALVEEDLDQAYQPLFSASLADQLVSADPDDWPGMIDAHRALVTSPDFWSGWGEQLAEHGDYDVLAGLLRLAAAGWDKRVLTDGPDPSARARMLAELAGQPELVVAATDVLNGYVGLDDDGADAVDFARAVALAQLGRLDEAVDLARALAARDPAASPRRLSQLFALPGPGLGELMKVFAPPVTLEP